jgi:DamX protein
LFAEIIEQADLDADFSEVQGDVDKLSFVFAQVLGELRAESAELVLQINYAHELSSGVLDQLMKLIENLRNQGGFHAVLWMDLDSAMAFENRIAPLNIEFSTIEVLRFTAAEINDYLKFVFESNDQDFVFDKETVKKIIVGSGGEAERIDQLALQALESNPKFSGGKKESYLLLKSMVAVAVTAIVIIILLPDEETDTDNSIASESMDEPDRVIIPINRPEPEEEPVVIVPPVVEELPVQNAIAEIPEPVTEVIEGESEVVENIPESVELVEVTDAVSVDISDIPPVSESVVEDVDLPESEPAPEPLVEVVDAEPAPPAPVEDYLTAYDRQLDVLLSHADNEAFIQLLGTYDEGVAIGFIDDNEIDDSFYYIRTDLNGRDWFVVLYGSFVSERAAINALPSLPENLQEGGPWVRNMRNIRSTIVD